MKLKTRLLLMAAFCLLAIPLMLTGNASAVVYNPDGALLNGTTGLWEMPQVACRGVSSSYFSAGDFTLDPGTAITRADLNPSSTGTYGTTSCYVPRSGFTGPYITYFATTYGGDTLGANCMAAGFSWKSGSGCYPVYWQHAKDLAGTSWETKTAGTSYRSCMKCHNSTYMTVANGHSVEAGEVAEYVNASHKNASRKIVPGSGLANVWLDSNDVEHFGVFPYLPGLNSPSTAGPYGSTTTYNLRMVDWVNGKIEDTTANASFVGLRNLPTGVYTQWYWEFGYYGVDPERGVYNAIARSNGQPSAFMTGCFFCHGTGAVGSNTIDATKEPERSFPGISWNTTTTYAPGSRPGVVNLRSQIVTRANRSNAAADLPATYKYGQWDEFGVVCSSCHASSDGSHQNVAAAGQTIAWGSGTAIEGASVNAVCGQCHVRGGSSNGTVTAPKTEQITLRKNVGTGHPNYHATDFLNSPHARFTGTYGQISDATKYGSSFLTDKGGCVACHNPHGSARVELIELTEGTSAEPLEGIETTCADCHTAKTDLTKMNHPVGAFTPADTHDACVTCHMGPSGRHLFRITLDTNYTTTQPTAFPAKPDGTFTEAVWVDLKSACGQCHDSKVGIPHFTRKDQAMYAKNIHNSKPTASFSWKKSTTATLTVDFTAAGCPVGDTCTYAWTFGDGGIDTGETPSHQYADGNPYLVTLTITDETTGGTSSPYAKTVKASTKNAKPSACNTVDVVGYTVTVTDCSTDDVTLPAGSVKVKWGRKTIPISEGNPLGVFTKDYTPYGAGSYIIRMIVTDAGGKKDSINHNVTVPVKYLVSGHVYRLDGTTPVVGASVRLKDGPQVVKMAATNSAGAYTLKNVSPGSYTVEAVKYGLVLTSTPAVVTNADVTAADITADR